MKIATNSFSARTQLVIKQGFDGQVDFAEKTGVNRSSVSSRYLKCEDIISPFQFDGKFIGALTYAGFNIVWYATGEGEIYADNENGRFLKRRYGNKHQAKLEETDVRDLARLKKFTQKDVEEIAKVAAENAIRAALGKDK